MFEEPSKRTTFDSTRLLLATVISLSDLFCSGSTKYASAQIPSSSTVSVSYSVNILQTGSITLQAMR